MTVKTVAELRQIYINEYQSQAPTVTDDAEGSNLYIQASSTALLVSEMSRLTLDEFSKTFFESAEGPQFSGDSDNLERLAIDHFGTGFERPDAVAASGEVTFSRPNTDYGTFTIPAGTVVTTIKDADGQSIRFETDSAVSMSGTSVNADITAVVAGTGGNVLADKVTVIESTLLDSSVTVNNALAVTGGTDTESDATYRETIKNKIVALKAAVKAAIEAAAKGAAGVEYATVVQLRKPVIEYDIATDDILSGAEFFRIPFPICYVADEDGNSSSTIIANASAAIAEVIALGVYIQVLGATASSLDWTLDITLDPGGPNYSTLVGDTSLITDSMELYILEIDIGSGFDISDATDEMLAIWGPAGTGDITTASTTIPAADVAGSTGVKLIPGALVAS